MSVSIIIDLLILAILAISLYLGWTKGMVRGLLALAATILSILIATQIGSFASGLLIEHIIRPATHNAIENHLIELDPNSFNLAPIEEIEQTIEAIENDLVREKAKELLATIDLPSQLFPDSAKDTVQNISGELVDAVLDGIVRDILSAVICVISFAILSVVFRPVIWIVEKAFYLPLLKQVNQIGGLLSGAVKGILLVLIAVWVLRLTGYYVTEEVIADSYILKFVVTCLDSIIPGTASA